MKLNVENLGVKLTGRCECGGEMVQVKDWRGRFLLEWKCSRSRWWQRSNKHAYLVLNAELVPASSEKLEAKKS